MLPEQTDALIVGAGPAGLSAAIELKRKGIHNVVVAEREGEVGGMPRLCHHTGFGRVDLHRIYSGPRYAQHYRELALKFGVELYTHSTITGWLSPSQLSYTSPGGIGKIEARALLLATGVRERPRAARLIPGTRPQGVYTTGSLQRFVYQEHLPVGARAVIVGAELISLSALLTLRHAGLKVSMMVTELSQHQIYFPYTPMKWALADLLMHTSIHTRTRVTNILGRERVEGIEITHLVSGKTEVIACDSIVFTGEWIPENEMARLGGLSIDPGTRGPRVDADFRSSMRGVFAAGNVLRGVATADDCALEGRRTGASIYQFLFDQLWPERGLPIEVVWPLAWVCPNSVPLVKSSRSGRYRFRSKEFRNRSQLQVRQGDHLLYSQSFRHLIVNEIMDFDGTWTTRVDHEGPPIQIVLAN
jgi:thioredoxin reductase